MGIYDVKAYAIPGKEGDVIRLLAEQDAATPMTERVDGKTLVTGESNTPYDVMVRLRPFVTYMWAYNPTTCDEDQADYGDRITIEFNRELAPPGWQPVHEREA